MKYNQNKIQRKKNGGLCLLALWGGKLLVTERAQMLILKTVGLYILLTPIKWVTLLLLRIVENHIKPTHR